MAVAVEEAVMAVLVVVRLKSQLAPSQTLALSVLKAQVARAPGGGLPMAVVAVLFYLIATNSFANTGTLSVTSANGGGYGRIRIEAGSLSNSTGNMYGMVLQHRFPLQLYRQSFHF